MCSFENVCVTAGKQETVSGVVIMENRCSKHTYLTRGYYVDLAGRGLMLRRFHCTPGLLTHAITTNVRNSVV